MYPARFVEPQSVGWVEKRMVACGKPNCRCSKGKLHGPYTYLAFRVWHEQKQRWVVRRKYVSKDFLTDLGRGLAARKEAERALTRFIKHQASILKGVRGKILRGEPVTLEEWMARDQETEEGPV